MNRVFLLSLLALSMVACEYENEENLMSQVACDTLSVGYSSDIEPIIGERCSSCHVSGNESGIVLVTYEDVKTIVDAGYLPGVIRHDEGFIPMPKNGSRLDDCSIKKIEIWIQNGAYND